MNEAITQLKAYHDQKDRDWSSRIRIKHNSRCVECNEFFDQEVCESHHIEPRHISPHKAHDEKNGIYVCMWRHAWLHKDNPVAMNMVLLRLLRILTHRHCRPINKCQQKLLGLSNEEVKEERAEETIDKR